MTLHSATEEKNLLITVIEEARATINDLQDDLRSQEAAVQDLTQQLSHSHLTREEASKYAARTIESLHTGTGAASEEKSSSPDEY